MKILTVFTQAIENNTSSMIRCRNVINGMAEIGNEVVVYSPFPDMKSIYYGESYNIHESIEVRRYGRASCIGSDDGEKLKGKMRINIPIKRIKELILTIYRKFDLFGAAILNIKYVGEILRGITQEKYDIILSFSSPIATHLISNIIYSKKKEARYIQQWGDPLVADITRKSLTPIWIQRMIESTLLKKAEKIFYVSPFTLKEQQRAYSRYSKKMYFLPVPAEERIYEKTYNKRLKIGYFGSYYTSARNIIPLYEAVMFCDNIDLIIVGDSDIELDERNNIKIIKRTTPDEVDRLIVDIDVVICLLNSKGSQIPGKIYNYACTNKEILMILDGERSIDMQLFFEQYKRFSFSANNKKEILKILRSYEKNGVSERKPVIAFTPQIVAEKMIGQ